MRFRYVYLGLGSILVAIILLLSDPDSGIITDLPFGAGTLTILIVLLSSVLYVGFLHLSRRALMDYLDLSKFFAKAQQSPEGAGLAIVGVGLIMISIALVIMAATN